MFNKLNKKKATTLFLTLLFVFYLAWPSMNPFAPGMFEFHDETQVGRIESFKTSLQAMKIPPRLAPEYSFNLGFPVFNFYAPAAYWITGVIAMLGISSITAVKLSFLLAISSAFLGMYYLLSRFFDHYAALLGASAYVTSTYFATEIVIRGNLAESWFLAFFPLSLGLLVENSRSKKASTYILTALSLSLLFTSHNMLSLFAIPIASIFLFFFKNKRRNLLALFNGVLLCSYFLIPALLESHLVQAATLSKNFNYVDHFLCTWQLWNAHGWQFGGSLTGCDADMMSFKLGKAQTVIAVLGLLTFFAHLWKHRKKITSEHAAYAFLALLSVGSLFLTLSYSKPIWDVFEPVMALFQFPWRFLVFGMFGIGFFSAYLMYTIKHPLRYVVIAGLIVVFFISGRKYFIKPMMEHGTYDGRYNSLDYRQRILAYNMREYLVQGVDYEYWHYLNPLEVNNVKLDFDYNAPVEFAKEYVIDKNGPFEKKVTVKDGGPLLVNVHHFPFWHIFVNNQEIAVDKVDHLARPEIQVKAGDTILVKYGQTIIEMIGNMLTLLGFVLLFNSKRVLRRLATRK